MALKSIRPALCGVAGSILAMSIHLPLVAQSTGAKPSPEQNSVSVPFVGCESDGQVGPIEAPHGNSKSVAVPPEVALRLAYYQAASRFGVLAPRGWYCFSTYGSNGSSLFVSPNPISAAELFSTKLKRFEGPAIQISAMNGDTSGRFSVARTIARVFPAHSSFVRRVIAEGIEPESSFPFGPYPADKLKYLGTEKVEYQTPANAEGLGTDSRLQKNSNPISGVVILYGKEPNLLYLSVRLSPDQRDLVRFIIGHAERNEALR